jgi:hypothetical protein
VIIPSQGLYLHTTEHRKNNKRNIHVSNGIRTHDSSNEAAKTYALCCAAIVTGIIIIIIVIITTNHIKTVISVSREANILGYQKAV